MVWVNLKLSLMLASRARCSSSCCCEADKDLPLQELAETIKKLSFKLARAGELVGREAARRLGLPFGIIDLSLAPTPVPGDSVANIIEAMGFERAGTHGTTAALALLTDAVKKGGAMASGSVGGMSGAFIPVSEDAGMIEAAALGALSLDKLEAWTSVCSVGIDMVAVPGSTSAETIAAIIADELAIGVMNNKTTAVRIIPVPGRRRWRHGGVWWLAWKCADYGSECIFIARLYSARRKNSGAYSFVKELRLRNSICFSLSLTAIRSHIATYERKRQAIARRQRRRYA